LTCCVPDTCFCHRSFSDTGRTRGNQKAKKSAGANLLTLDLLGSPTWTRTRDLRINSPSLYRLSYQGTASNYSVGFWGFEFARRIFGVRARIIGPQKGRCPAVGADAGWWWCIATEPDDPGGPSSLPRRRPACIRETRTRATCACPGSC
jgi:hypothetical protein